MNHKRRIILSFVLAVLVIATTSLTLADAQVPGRGHKAGPPARVYANAPAGSHTVDSNGDTSDANPGDGACLTAGGTCTLRAAIEESNAWIGPDTIGFDASIGMVAPNSPLPALSDSVAGTTIKGNPTWIFGDFAGTGAQGLVLVSAGNKLQGLWITNFDTTGLIVQGDNNIIGTDGDGIDDATEGNVISNNGEHGVNIENNATGNWLAGNLIGLTADGTGEAGNVQKGVYIHDGAHTNRIGTNGDGTSDELERNVISGNDEQGISISGTGVDHNVVAGNYIGTNAAGDAAIPNTWSGVSISFNSADNLIGTDGNGTADELEGNLISGNESTGVYLSRAKNNVIAGNYIGTNATGDGAVPNANNGVTAYAHSEYNLIGTDGNGISDELEGNLISGNQNDGIEMYYHITGTVIAGNYIGTNAAGDAALPNEYRGVLIRGSVVETLIGTDADGSSDDLERNVISGNNSAGIQIENEEAEGNVVAGNYIGTNAAGDGALPNGSYGVWIDTCSNNRVGGTTPAERNVISGNGYSGVTLHPTATLNLVQGNYIGTDASGVGALGNGHNGVNLSNGAVGNTIGGTASGAANLIAFNGRAGVRVYEHTPQMHSYDNGLRGNAIFSNTDLGIDLSPQEGVTPNDPGDGDAGANNLQNYPVLSAAASGGGQTLIEGSLNSNTNTTFELDFYANSACDSSGYGQGEIYLGTDTVTTDGTGDVSFSTALAANVPAGYYATATATDPDGNTSEFSTCRVVTALCVPVSGADFGWTPTTPIVGQGVTLTGAATGTLPISFTWDLGDGNAGTGQTLGHSYATTGTYTVIMTATNCPAASPAPATVSHTLDVVAEPPVCTPVSGADFGWTPITPIAGQGVTLTGVASGTPPIDYSWNLGDGSSGTGQTFNHTYASPGGYTVVMTAANCLDDLVTHTQVIDVAPGCVQVAGVSLTQVTTGTVYAGDTVDFSADLAPEGLDTPYTYTVLLDGAETVPPTGSSHDPLAFTHTFPNTGTYQVEVRIWNCAMSGVEAMTDTIEMTVYQPGTCVPLDSITISGEATGYVGIAYTFDTTYTPAGASPPISYTWDDGSTDASSTRTFDLTGSHTLTVSANNCQGAPVTDEHTIDVQEAPPCVPLSGVALTWVNSGTLYLGDQASFNADLSPNDAAKPYSYTLDYGDGGGPVDGTHSDDPFSFGYTYAATGTYTVTLEAWTCAMTQPVRDSVQVVVSEPVTEKYTVYLPIVLKN